MVETMFGTKNSTPEKEFEKKFIEPGINEVKINGVVENTKAKSPTMDIEFELISNPVQKATISLTFTEKSAPYQNTKIKHIATKVADKDLVEKTIGEVAGFEDYVTKTDKLLTGKSLRVKFVGKYVPGKDGKNGWYKASLGLPEFAESLTTPLAATKLKFDVNDRFDMEKPVEPTTNLSKPSDDLPF